MAGPVKACYILSRPVHLTLTKPKGSAHLWPATAGGLAHENLERQIELARLSPSTSVRPAHKSPCTAGRLTYLRPATGAWANPPCSPGTNRPAHLKAH
jgi:hypothetical protein